MEYELSVRNERNVVEPTASCLTDSEKINPFTISNLIPYANSTKAMEIVDILRENGYDVSAIIRLPTQQTYATPIWSRLKFTIPAVRRLFENYTRPIKWFDKMKGGETIAHKIMTIRGTPVYLDLMEKQLTKEQICDLMTVQDDKGNTPVHLIGESSLATFDRLIPYIKHCWTIKNNRNQTPFGSYIQRFKEFHIKVKEHKLRRFIQETPVIEDREVYELFRFVDKEDYMPVLPLLVEKGVNLTATGDGGIGFFFSSFTVELLQEFKRYGVDLTITDENGCNLLHGLFMEKDRRDASSVPALIEFLVKEGVNINQINKYGVTPLMKSMQKPSYKGLEAMEALLKNGADPNLHGPNTPTPLVMILGRNTSYTYSKQTKISLVKLLLDHGAKPTSIRIHGERFSPLAMAITNVNSIKLARLLIDYGADVNERDDVGNSMLHVIKEGPIGEVDEKKIFRMIDFLITYIDINDQNALGETTLHQILEYTEYAEYLVQKGADINIRDNRGNTPILMALDSVEFLLASPKLDWLAINRECKSALHILVRSYEERMKPFLEKFNAMSKEQQDAIKKVFSTNDGIHKTALHGAVSMLEFESVKVCVEVFGLSPATQNKHLILCDDNRYESKRVQKLIQIFTYLLEHGANINAQDEKGNTALHYALRKDSYLILEYITFLLKNGADPTIKNYLGLSAVDLMPSIGNLISSGSCFSSKLPISAEEEAEKSRKLKVEDEIINNDEPEYDEEEFDEMFNSDEMSENDMMEANDEDEFGSEEEIIFPDEDDDDDMDDDDDGEDDDDEDDDDEDDDGRLRRHPAGFTFRL